MKKIESQINIAAKIIKKGGIVAFPTETVYGLGANAFNPQAVEKIFKVKKRPFSDPLIVHICDKKQIKDICKNPNDKIKRLIDKFWPGPLTIVMKKKSALPDIVTAGKDTVAVRMPQNPIAIKLIKKCGTPIAAPSANLFGRLSPTTSQHVKKQIGKNIDFIIDGGRCTVGLESTIIDMSSKKYMILRCGVITINDIENVLGEKISIAGPDYNQIFPGLFPKHYSPKAQVVLFEKRKLKKFNEEDSAFVFFQDAGEFAFKIPKEKIEILSPSGNLSEAASNLYYKLHRLDEKGAKKIYVEKIPENDIGLAIMERIKKAAGLGCFKKSSE